MNHNEYESIKKWPLLDISLESNNYSTHLCTKIAYIACRLIRNTIEMFFYRTIFLILIALSIMMEFYQ